MPGVSCADDPCPVPLCAGDCNGDLSVDFGDLLAVLSEWGPCPPLACPSDFDHDGLVGFKDLLVILSNWGPCN